LVYQFNHGLKACLQAMIELVNQVPGSPPGLNQGFSMAKASTLEEG